jgi:hypothetical protein
MKSIEVSDFAEDIIDYLTGDEVLTILRHGEPVGYYIPAEVTTTPARNKRAIEELGETVQRILDRTGLTEDELVQLLDPNVPLHELPPPRRKLASHASRG